MAGLSFSRGERVEVSLEEEEYGESWFPATVQEERETGLLVEYERAGKNGCPESVKVSVDYAHARPYPANGEPIFFVLLKKVEAYIDFGWRSGVITKKLPDNKYLISLKLPEKKMQVHHSLLRPHMQWKDGIWVDASQDVFTARDYQGLLKNIYHQTGIASREDTRSGFAGSSSGTARTNCSKEPMVDLLSKPDRFSGGKRAVSQEGDRVRDAGESIKKRRGRPKKNLPENLAESQILYPQNGSVVAATAASAAAAAAAEIVEGLEGQGLPFVKNSIVWKYIDSMAVFQQLPQKPHFQPLSTQKESFREGSAIALMVNFSGVAQKATTLKLDDPQSTIEDNLETLVELEDHGFDVKVLRDRLKKLLLMKAQQEGLQKQFNENKDKIVQKNEEKSEIGERIGNIDEKIRQLQKERDSALLAMEETDQAIASLESTISAINDKIRSVREESKALVSAPW